MAEQQANQIEKTAMDFHGNSLLQHLKKLQVETRASINESSLITYAGVMEHQSKYTKNEVEEIKADDTFLEGIVSVRFSENTQGWCSLKLGGITYESMTSGKTDVTLYQYTDIEVIADSHDGEVMLKKKANVICEVAKGTPEDVNMVVEVAKQEYELVLLDLYKPHRVRQLCYTMTKFYSNGTYLFLINNLLLYLTEEKQWKALDVDLLVFVEKVYNAGGDNNSIIQMTFITSEHDILQNVYIRTSKKDADLLENAILIRKKTNLERSLLNRNASPFDGRLWLVDKRNYSELKGYLSRFSDGENSLTSKYRSTSRVKGFGIKLYCIKKTLNKEMRMNVMLAASLRHFAIVPVFACYDFNKERNSFFSPCLRLENLQNLLDAKLLTYEERMRLIYHVVCAVDFLHKPVSTRTKVYRHAILHLDITASNIVLDDRFNARLVDFASSRELVNGNDEIKCTGLEDAIRGRTKGYIPDEKSNVLNRSTDYFNIGVVIRQCLTGADPTERCEHQKYLRTKDLCDCFSEQRYVWKYENADNTSEWHKSNDNKSYFQHLLTVSTACLTGPPDIKTGQMDIKNEIRNILHRDNICYWKQSKPEAEDWVMCEMCLINTVHDDKHLIRHASNCSNCSPIRVCLSCIKSHYFNPIQCHSCTECQPVIGSDETVCLCLSGSGGDNRNVFQSNVEKMAVTLQSVLHPTMCIRNIWQLHEPQSMEHIYDVLKGTQMTQMVLYFSGHGFQVGPCNATSLKITQTFDIKISELEKLFIQKYNLQSFIVILDCCFPQKVETIGNRQGCNIMQIHACYDFEKSGAGTDNEHISHFTKYLLSALIKPNTECGECNTCSTFYDQNTPSVLTLTMIHEFIKKHYITRGITVNSTKPTPVIHLTDANKQTVSYSNASEMFVRVTGLGDHNIITINFHSTWEQLLEEIKKTFQTESGDADADVRLLNSITGKEIWNMTLLRDVLEIKMNVRVRASKQQRRRPQSII